MINVLLAEKNINDGKEIINKLLIKNPNIRLCGIATTLDELLSITNRNHIDIILFNLKLSDYKKIQTNKLLNKKRFNNSIILFLDNYPNNNTINSSYLLDYIIKETHIEKITKKINFLLLSKELLLEENLSFQKKEDSKIKNKINKELKYLSFNFNHCGTKYIMESIYILYKLKDYYDDNLEKDIYPIVAKKYGKTIHNIKMDIIYATNIMYCEAKEEKLMKYLKIYEPYKPGPKRIITTILGKI